MLISLKEMLKNAYTNKYAVGAFNCLSLENVIGAIKAAEELRSPIIIQLAEVQFPCAPIDLMAPLYLNAAKAATVPVAVHLDHGESMETCIHAMRLGFGSVMYDGASLPFAENVRITREVVRIAKAFSVDVEAELGKVGNADNNENKKDPDIYTGVQESLLFIQRTGIDALAIAIGNKHGHYIATPQLNIARLTEIHEACEMPLVLHGGTGTSEEDFKACIHNGICKINVATAIQLGVTNHLRQYLQSNANPDYIEMKEEVVKATKEVVAYHIKLFESEGRF